MAGISYERWLAASARLAEMHAQKLALKYPQVPRETWLARVSMPWARIGLLRRLSARGHDVRVNV